MTRHYNIDPYKMQLFIVSVFTIFLQFTVTLGCQCEKMTKVKETYNLQKHDKGDRVCLCCYAREDAKIFFRRERIKVCDVDEGGDVNNKCYKQGDGAGVFIVGEVNQDDAGNWTCGNDLSSSNVVEIKDQATMTTTESTKKHVKSSHEPTANIKASNSTSSAVSTRISLTDQAKMPTTESTKKHVTSSHEPAANIKDIYMFVFPLSVVVMALIVIVTVIIIFLKQGSDKSNQDYVTYVPSRRNTSVQLSDIVQISNMSRRDTSIQLSEIEKNIMSTMALNIHAAFSEDEDFDEGPLDNFYFMKMRNQPRYTSRPSIQGATATVIEEDNYYESYDNLAEGGNDAGQSGNASSTVVVVQ